MSENAFDPSRYLVQLKGKDYLEVQWRLVWLRDVHPDAVISQELIDHDKAEKWALFKTSVSIPGGGHAEGFGSESARDFGDYIEKACTKSLGRALGALGFGTQFSAHEFGGEHEAERPVDAPLPARGRTVSQNTIPDDPFPRQQQNGNVPQHSAGGSFATPKQLKYMEAIAREQGIDEVTLSQEVEQLYGKPVAQLDRREASAYIERMQSRRNVTELAS